MEFDCSKLEEALREEEPELVAAARAHAESCEACRAELQSWDELSIAARELHQEWDSPELWDRIDAALPSRPSRFHVLSPGRAGWRLLLSAAAVLVLTISSVWLLRRPHVHSPVTTASRQFLTERALKEGVELQAVLNEFQAALEKADCLIAHNISFDEKIVGAEFLRNKMADTIPAKKKVCTMQSSTAYCAIPGPYGNKWPKLAELHQKLFQADFEGAHNAAADIAATAKCFWELKKLGVIKF